MKLNWKLRFQNKVWLSAFLVTVLTFLYQIAAMLGITAPVTEDMLLQIVGMVLNLLTAMGILIDPTTSGVSDSTQVLNTKKCK